MVVLINTLKQLYNGFLFMIPNNLYVLETGLHKAVSRCDQCVKISFVPSSGSRCSSAVKW
jgi:hypothetical protein